MLKKILIANRGEIAVRVIRAAKSMGIKTVAVYSEADKNSLHVQLADQAVCIGPAPSLQSYLRIDAILEAARETGADSVHPGYGFLSESSTFAQACKDNGLVFIGPSPELIESMGNKSQARKTMIEAGVPVVPGSKEPMHNAQDALKAAREMGWPIMIKASGGGGGKGMRVSLDESDFEEQFNIAQHESVSFFDNDTMYLERALFNPRHVEVQIMADSFGNVVSLGERDCSIQRNHQKMVEESPCPFLSEEKREAIARTAVTAAKAVGYESAGTIEFLVDDAENFYFMEMNTRIQVEHSVAEMRFNIDLVREMIRVASGLELSWKQEDLKPVGHAIECRINAERPARNFMPSPGPVTALNFPGGNGVRIDSAMYAGGAISSYYDSMVAKIITHAPTREEAIEKMKCALEETVIGGVYTNLDIQYAIMCNEVFRNGEATTSFIEHFLAGEL
ncbi:MAG: acetyl-CoA carboxylase biotin carboxylase subunit [Coriobacteriia bacterium]|nr:acetyl-CoA carboxylase biotin carboxylase subunit [Coriobacteriia bacterium]